MKIVIDQFGPILGDLDTNSTRVLNTLKTYDSEIYVFPELCLSGYFFTAKEELAPYALEASHPFFDMLQFISTAENKTITLGFAEKDGKDYYNSAITIFPNKEQTFIYRKTHLFYKENLVFSPGDSGYKVVEWDNKGIRIGTMICYDWRFPEAARSLALEGADIILCPSNLVTDKWQKALATRAVENKVFIAVANRVGREVNAGEVLEFTGKSSFYNPEGDIVAEASPYKKSIIMAEFEFANAKDKSINSYNDILSDRRPDMYVS